MAPEETRRQEPASAGSAKAESRLLPRLKQMRGVRPFEVIITDKETPFDAKLERGTKER